MIAFPARSHATDPPVSGPPECGPAGPVLPVAELLSAIVVTHDSAPHVAACLASLRDEARRLPLEIIVADSASTDTTLSIVRERFPEACIAALRENRGFGTAVNAAARLARGTSLLLLNPDATLRPRSAVELVAAAARAGAAVVGPRIVRPDGQVEMSAGAMVGFLTEARHKLAGVLHRGGVPPVAGWVERRSRRPAEPDWVSGACLLIRRDAWTAVGGMDESFFLYLEDVDLCARVRAAGGRVVYWPRAEAVHVGGASAPPGTAADARARLEYRRSQLLFYRKHHGEDAVRLLKLYLEAKLVVTELLAWAGGRRDEARLAGEVLAMVRSFP